MEKKVNILTMRGIFSSGYGLIPKKVMQDRRISVEAKAIYAYLMSYAGKGDTAYPSVSLIISDLRIGEKRYYTHFHKLIKAGYIRVTKVKTGDNKFTNNIYEIVSDPSIQERKVRDTRASEIEEIVNTFVGYFQAKYYEVNDTYEQSIPPRVWAKIRMKIIEKITFDNLSLKSLEAKADRFFDKQKGKGIKAFMEVLK